MWSTALAKLGIGGAIALLAGLVSGHLKLRRRNLVTVPAIVTSVDPVTSGGTVHWRVGFAYVAHCGTAFEVLTSSTHRGSRQATTVQRCIHPIILISEVFM